jgi:3-phenylpropionate/trans-cinnamate dioxygenase ferredoxin component
MLEYDQIDPLSCDYVGVAQVSDLPNGERLYLTIDELPIVVFNIAGGYFAIADLCSHDDGPLGDGDLDGLEIICPRHGARFDIRTGKVLSLPAIVNIPAYPVRIVEEEIQIGIPREN